MTPTQQNQVAARTQSAPASRADHDEQRYVIRRMRHLIPAHIEPMSWREAERIANAQGALLARLSEKAGMDVVEFVATLPVIRVNLDPLLPDFCTSYWDDPAGQWIIVVRATDRPTQRRFSVIHEFKRILDRGHEGELYDPRYPQGLVQAAMAADQFAARALMPTRSVRAALRDGASVPALARRFNVSILRATSRLSDLNLLPIIKHPERREL